MRKENSIKNIIVALIMTIINVIIGFIAQKIFINTLGEVYLGINGLFTNIISMLSIADLGIGTAIVYNMYKPIADKNIEKIKSLMNFYKKSYRIVAIVVLILGTCITPFLNFIIGKNNISTISNINIYMVFYLFLVDAVSSYLLTYKRSMLYANQKNYVINSVHILCILFMNMFQIGFLLYTKNYYAYLIIKIIFRIIENLTINMIVEKMYPYLNEKENDKLDDETKQDINKRLEASIFHNIGGFIVLGTDNIIISKFLGIVVVGLYSNYYLIINTVNNLLSQIFSAVTASVGNLLVEENMEKSHDIEGKISFANFWLYTVAGIMIYCLITPFIKVWLGESFLLDNTVTIILIFNFFMQGMRKTMQVFSEAGGVCYENRFVPIVEAIVNIIASIALVKVIGLAGVFLGTIISSLVLHLYSFPKYVYKGLLKKEPLEYIKMTFKYLIIMTIIMIITVIIINMIKTQSIYLQLLINFLLSFLIPNILLYIMYRKSDNFIYYKELLKKIVEKGANKLWKKQKEM